MTPRPGLVGTALGRDKRLKIARDKHYVVQVLGVELQWNRR